MLKLLQRRGPQGAIELGLEVQPQPSDTSCGPTCLHAAYRYYGETLELDQVIAETQELPTGGTLAVMLGCHALKRGYRVRLYSYNVELFDPTWFRLPPDDVRQRLEEQASLKATNQRLGAATRAYTEYLSLGGTLAQADLSLGLLRRYLRRGVPLMTGLSATFLYRNLREYGPDCIPDDVRGEPVGHFVLLCGYRAETDQVLVADPWQKNPLAGALNYWAATDRLLTAILLGVMTYDGTLLVIEPHNSDLHEVAQ